LAELVEEESFFELLDKATSAQEVIDYLKER
jgi:mannitol/fructose-specific phosphotransferase system IIA component (Ntr-type)